MAEMTMIDAIRDALKLEMQRDPAVMLLGEDIGQLGGVFRATDGLQQFFGPNRVVDTPLAESAIIGASLGLALTGMKPVAEIQFLGIYPERFSSNLSATRAGKVPFPWNSARPGDHSDALWRECAHARVPQ